MSNAFDEIKRRCEAANLEYDDEGVTSAIWMPWGAEYYDQFVFSHECATWITSLPFEHYARLRKYKASWLETLQVIECGLVPSDRRGYAHLGSVRRLITRVVQYLRERQSVTEGNPSNTAAKQR